MLLSQKISVIFDYFMITVGSFIAALGLGLFMVEADVVPGGVTGLSMAINFVWPKLSVGTLIWLLNVPLFIWGIIELGNAFGLRTFYGFSTNAVFIDFLRGEIQIPFIKDYLNFLDLQNSEPIRHLIEKDFLFAIIIGTFCVGVGLGIVFKFKGTTAGSEIVAAILKKRLGMTPGTSLIIVDLIVVLIATVVLYLQHDPNRPPALVLMCYAAFHLCFTSVIIDRIIYGLDYAKNMMIFSNKNEEIADYIIKHLDRGVTAFYARGMYTKQDKEVLMTIVSPSDARVLAPHIRELDPNAFLILSNVHEVIGEGFRSREEVDLKLIKKLRQAEAEAAKAAQEAIRAEIAAKEAQNHADKAREFANQYGTEHHDENAHKDAKTAEQAAIEAKNAAKLAREHAMELENAASSIESCVDLSKDDEDDDPTQIMKR